MNAKLFLAQLLAQGNVIPDNAYEVNVNTHEVVFYAEEPYEQQLRYSGKHTSNMIFDGSIEFDNEQIAYETYVLEFEDSEFTVEEFNQWLAENPFILEELKAKQQIAVKRLAELGDVINAALAEGEKLAEELGLPFNVKLGGSIQDVRKLAAVDWDSSSMYC